MNIAAPPSVGVGLVCTWRASDDGATTAPKRIASNRTTGVSSSVVPSATAQMTGVALHESGYGVNFEQRRLAWSRTSVATPWSSTSRSTRPISDAISASREHPCPPS